MARVLHKLCYVSSVASCSDAFQTWKAKTKFKYSKGVDLLLKGSETLDELFKKNEALRKELVYINEKLQHQAGLIKDEET